MKRATLLLCCVWLFLSLGCFRTHYQNLHPHVPPAVHAPDDDDRVHTPSWQHFFVYGWFPIERTIDASAKCGGLEYVRRIETQRSFVQALIFAVAGYYGVNIYSPYTGAVVCDHPAEP